LIAIINSLHCFHFGTYRTPSHLALSLEDARKNNFALGVKLVRGAYHPYEVAAHHSKGSSLSISPDELPPVWAKKNETDRCYNQCVQMLLNAVRKDIDESHNISHLGWTRFGTAWISWLKGNVSPDVVKSIVPSAGLENRNTKMPGVGILFGTHNRESAKLVLSELVKNGLAKPLLDGKSFEDSETIIGIKPETVERVAIAQLYGESVEQQNPVPLH